MELNEKMGLGGFDKQERENCHTAASRTTGADRRKFLTALAALAANATAARAPRGHIDVHHHFFPPTALDRVPYRRSRSLLSAWTPQEALAEMDANHVATAIASIPMPVWLGDVQASRSLARKWNEYSAQLVRDHPERFGFFASVPLPDAEGSLREISYALDVLKADGIILMTNYEGKYPGDAPFAPVLEELNHRKAVVFFHPTNPNAQTVLNGVPGAWAELPHDTTRAVLSLLVSGSFARLRDIRFHFAHAGGTIPMLTGR